MCVCVSNNGRTRTVCKRDRDRLEWHLLIRVVHGCLQEIQWISIFVFRVCACMCVRANRCVRVDEG